MLTGQRATEFPANARVSSRPIAGYRVEWGICDRSERQQTLYANFVQHLRAGLLQALALFSHNRSLNWHAGATPSNRL
jgi:hypothetical protein